METRFSLKYFVNGCRYIPGLKDFSNYNTKMQRQAEFHIKLPANQYISPNSIHFCFLIKIKKGTDEANDIDNRMVMALALEQNGNSTVGNTHFFAYWIKETEIR